MKRERLAEELAQERLVESCGGCSAPMPDCSCEATGTAGTEHHSLPGERACESVPLRMAQIEPDIPQTGFPFIAEHFEVREMVGAGGMGTVYRVFDQRSQTELAIKLLHRHLAADAGKVASFQREVTAAIKLDHPNLVSVYEYGTTFDGIPYSVMEFVRGSTLADMLKTKLYLEPARAANLFRQICEGMSYAHAQGVIHLDLKPGNVLVREGEPEIAKIVDFGIARMVAPESGNMTVPEEVVGSLLYMSPEQCRGDILDSRSDVYSFGCLMYETLTGKSPFAGANPMKTIVNHLHEKPQGLSAFRKLDVPKPFETLVLHCLEKDPRNRYQFMEELDKDLESVTDGKPPVVALQQMSDSKSGRPSRVGQIAAMSLCLSIFAIPFFAHLSRFDTVSQVILLGRLAYAAIVIGFAAAILWRGWHAALWCLSQARDSKGYGSEFWFNILASVALIAAGLFTILFTPAVLSSSSDESFAYAINMGEFYSSHPMWILAFVAFALAVSVAPVCWRSLQNARKTSN